MSLCFQFIRFWSPADRGWAAALELYRNSFPPKEIRSEKDHVAALADPDFTADGIWLDGALVGILYHWQLPAGGCYVEHLAISPALRGKHLGSEVLRQFCSGKRVVLEIDPPETEIAIRRQHFYERQGFHRNPQPYLHPSFSRPFEPHALVLMSYPTPMTDAEVADLTHYVRDRVLRYSEHAEQENDDAMPNRN